MASCEGISLRGLAEIFIIFHVKLNEVSLANPSSYLVCHASSTLIIIIEIGFKIKAVEICKEQLRDDQAHILPHLQSVLGVSLV
jgi:hypothetical protein